MAFERIGLGGILSFDSQQAVTSMKQAAQALGLLNHQADHTPLLWQRMGGAIQGALDATKAKITQFSRGASQLGGALGAGAMAAAPITLALGKAFNTANDFEKQIAGVFSVVNSQGDVAASTLQRLRGFAQEMGAASVFSSTQAAEAMESMARNGMNAEGIMQGLGAVMNAAAADGISLNDAANIVSAGLNQFQLDATEATKVADVLAMAGATTATDIRQMGEALKYAGAPAKALGMDLYQTTAALASISNSGIGASMAGTHFTQMLNHLVKTTPKGRKVLEELGVSLFERNGDLKKMSDLVPTIDKALSQKFKGTGNRGKAIEELFSTEGALAFDALVAGLNGKDPKKAMGQIEEALRASGGTAKRQADARMNTFTGRITQLMGGVEAMSIEVMGTVSNNMKGAVDDLANGLGRVVSAFMMVKEGDVGGSLVKNGETATQIARGLADALKEVNGAWNTMVDKVRGVAQTLGTDLGGIGVRELTRMVTIITFVIGLGAPLLAMFAGVGFILTSVIIPALTGMAGMAAAVFSPVGAVLAIIGIIIYELREQFGDFFMGIWDAVQVVMPAIMESFSELFAVIRFVVNDLSRYWGDNVTGMATDWRTFAQNVVFAMATALQIVVGLVKWVILIVGEAIKIVDALFWGFVAFSGPIGLAISYLIGFKRLLVNIGTAVVDIFEGNWVRGLTRIGTAIVDLFLSPVIMVTKALMKLGEVMMPSLEMPAWLSTFANEGITGLVMGEMSSSGKATAPGSEDAPQNDAEQAMSVMADTSQMSMSSAPINVTVEDKKPVNVTVNSRVELDKRTLAVGLASHTQDTTERSGVVSKPGQRRRMLESGSAPTE